MFDKVIKLQEMLVDHATNGNSFEEALYLRLRKELMGDLSLKDLVPDFVRTNRSGGALWGYFKAFSPHWAPRREHIWAAFGPLLDYLEGDSRAPGDSVISDALATFDPEGVHQAWLKALERRHSDPEGAITSARTLLETVCKRILDEGGGFYEERDDLPKLYHEAAKRLNLAPSQHTEEVFKAILGNCQSVVNNLGTLRNKIGDAHGQGGRPIRPAERHAALAVNLAGAVATFLVETFLNRVSEKKVERPVD